MAQLSTNPERQATPLECIEWLEKRLSRLAARDMGPVLADLLNCVQVLVAVVQHDMKNR